jgi:hypothetical protein
LESATLEVSGYRAEKMTARMVWKVCVRRGGRRIVDPRGGD